MSYHVSIAGRAERDADVIANWLFKRSPWGARSWLLAYDSIKEVLSQSPLRCGLAPEGERVELELR